MKLLFIFYGIIFSVVNAVMPQEKMINNHVRYVALGDSYTICEGVDPKDSWPVILTRHLNDAGIKTELLANPSRTGWTTQNLIDRELPVFDKSDANFITLCIGVNDWVQGVSEKDFRTNLVYILDHIQKKIPGKNKILLLTIPDFSVTRQGKMYAGERDASAGIAGFNKIVEAEAEKRNLKMVDLFEISKAMKNDASLVAGDGLHPSAKEYAIWETKIFPVAKAILK